MTIPIAGQVWHQIADPTHTTVITYQQGDQVVHYPDTDTDLVLQTIDDFELEYDTPISPWETPSVTDCWFPVLYDGSMVMTDGGPESDDVLLGAAMNHYKAIVACYCTPKLETLTLVT